MIMSRAGSWITRSSVASSWRVVLIPAGRMLLEISKQLVCAFEEIQNPKSNQHIRK